MHIYIFMYLYIQNNICFFTFAYITVENIIGGLIWLEEKKNL